MNYFKINPIYTIIDIGTTKIFVIIAEKTKDQLNILGIGNTLSKGLERGVVHDIELTSEAIKEAINEAQSYAHIFTESVVVGISGSHIKSYFSQGMVSIQQNGISEKTIQEAIFAAQSIALPDDEKIIHTIPMNYIIDGINYIKNPLNMHGFRLEIITHIMTANKHAIANIVEACKKANLKIADIILEPIASAEAILNDEEKDLGSLLIDIGGGTSDIALYKNHALEYIQILNIAGNVFTKDLAICLNINREDAENIKKKYGLKTNQNEIIENIYVKGIDQITETTISSELVNDILNARAEELIYNIKNILDNYNNSYYLPSGIILTGGGALLKGLPEMISKYTGLRCRVGFPIMKDEKYKILKHPSYATSYGLLLYTIKNEKRFHQKNDISFVQKFKEFIHKFI